MINKIKYYAALSASWISTAGCAYFAYQLSEQRPTMHNITSSLSKPIKDTKVTNE